MKKIVLAIAIIATSISSYAQLGGLLKKAKDKITEKKTVETTTTAANNNQTATLNNPPTAPTNEGSNTKIIVQKGENTPEGYYLFDNPLGKILIASKPFSNASNNTKTTFQSNEFIYGRLQLKSGTIKEAFKFGEKEKGIPFHSLEYVVFVYKKGETKYNNDRLWNSCLVTDADLTKNYFDFDILPNPQNATTIISALANFSAGKSTAPLYAAINPTVFYEDGTYKINIILRNAVNDAWGKALEQKKWPTFETDFDYLFNANDVAALKKNKELAATNAQNNMQNLANAAQELPEQWLEKSSALVMGLTQDKLLQMLLGDDLKSLKLIKFFASSSNGGWTAIYDQGNVLPTYRKSNQYYTVFYKIVNPTNSNNGKCWFQTFGLRQQYMGGGTYGVATIDANEWHFAECDKMK